MENLFGLDEILQGKGAVNQIFENCRIVDITNNVVCSYIDGRIISTSEKCYCIWGSNKTCSNCITHSAYMEKKQKVKLHYQNDKVELIVAVPVTIGEKEYVLELIKDITDSLVVRDKYHTENSSIFQLINDFNQLAVMDPFTNLYNKKYVEKQIQEDMQEAVTKEETFVLAMIDIDNFKKVNDTFGHSAGDAVISQLVQIIHKHTDEHNCWAARYGGDEFLLAFHGEPLILVNEYCDNIIEEIHRETFRTDDRTFQVSITIGIYEYNPLIDNHKTLLDKVDSMMYQNKKHKKE